MSKAPKTPLNAVETDAVDTVLRRHTEQIFANELDALIAEDKGQDRPAKWIMSPRAVTMFLMGGSTPKGAVITPKYIGSRRLMEIAVSTLITDRALLLYGSPGTAKSWVSENLAAAISGDSTLLIQGTAGTDESAIRYGWNYAKLLTEGPSKAAMVESPMIRGMQDGKVVRLEELTRMPSEVQDTLITVLSEKTLPVPELNIEVQAARGFNVIASANNKDRGVNELSSALKRRFNTVVLPLPATLAEEVNIVTSRVASLTKSLDIPSKGAPHAEIVRVVTMFRELRNGQTQDNRTKLKSPSGTLSTAEAISVVGSGLALAAYFGDGMLNAEDWAAGMVGALVKDPSQDPAIIREYLESVVKERWRDVYNAVRDVL